MNASRRSVRRNAIFVAKVTLAAAIISYLLYKAHQDQSFSRLWEQPKDWLLLFAGFVCTFLSIVLSFFRWQILVVAVGIEFRASDALRLGSLGYVLNFVSPGSLGGDLFKAVLLARKEPSRKTEAVATVVIDRLMGLAVMLVLASLGILFSDLLTSTSEPAVRTLCYLILTSTLAGMIVVASLLYVPALTGEKLSSWARTIPLVGATISRLLGAVRTYRDQKPLLLQACLLSVVVDLLFILSYFLIAQGLPIRAPTLAEHLVIVPIASLAGAIPLTPAGLGTQEAAIEQLYRTIPGVAKNDGTIVAFAQRLTTIAVAIMGAIYYLTHRAEVHDAVADAEKLAEAG